MIVGYSEKRIKEQQEVGYAIKYQYSRDEMKEEKIRMNKQSYSKD